SVARNKPALLYPVLLNMKNCKSVIPKPVPTSSEDKRPSFSNIWCTLCDVPLCCNNSRNCFKIYHEKQKFSGILLSEDLTNYITLIKLKTSIKMIQ
ncbi:13229_t:CDS:2, partial [Entrophospora sp. SA101]